MCLLPPIIQFLLFELRELPAAPFFSLATSHFTFLHVSLSLSLSLSLSIHSQLCSLLKICATDRLPSFALNFLEPTLITLVHEEKQNLRRAATSPPGGTIQGSKDQFPQESISWRTIITDNNRSGRNNPSRAMQANPKGPGKKA